MSWFTALSQPRSIAIVGASDDASKISGRPLSYLRRFGYQGAVYPVNPRRDQVQGLPAYPSVSAIGEPVDMAVVCVPAGDVVRALADCTRAGVRLAVVFSSGFGETGEDGAARERELARVLDGSRLRVLGPNSLGLLATESAVTATFTSAFDLIAPLPGNLGIVSQSGAFGAFIVSSAQGMGLGVRTFVSTGNESDLGLPEVVTAVASDPGVTVLLLYIEGIRDGAAFRAATAAVRAAGQPIVAVKVGRTAAGRDAASLHTGAFTGSDRVYDVVLREQGVARVTSLDEMLDVAQLLSHPHRPSGRRVSVITISGGGGIMMADQAEASGLELAKWDGEWRDRLVARIPPYGSASNPIDVTAELIYRPELLESVLSLCAEHPGTDSVAVLIGNVAGREDQLIQVLAKAHQAARKPLAVAWIGGSGLAVGKLRAVGIPAYSDANRAIVALGHQARALAARARRAIPPAIEPARRAQALKLLTPLIERGERVADEVVGKALLALYGVRTPAEREVADATAAVLAADTIGYPVAVKLLSPDIVHREQIGGVRLGLHTAAEVRQAGTELLARAAELGIAAARLTVQVMVAPGLELLVGLDSDPTFGPMVVAGIGGTQAEILHDTAMASVPVDAEDALELIKSLRHAPLLDGWRGKGPRDGKSAAAVVAAVSQLGSELADIVAQLDVNPVIVGPEGFGAVAVDALVALRPGAAARTGPRRGNRTSSSAQLSQRRRNG